MATVEMTRPWKVIQELEADNSRLKKEAIIRRESDAENVTEEKKSGGLVLHFLF